MTNIPPPDSSLADGDELAHLFDYIQPQPSQRFYAQIADAPWRKHAAFGKGENKMLALLKQRPFVFGISVLSVLLVTLLWSTPPLQVQASDLLARLFAKASRDVVAVPTPAQPTPTMDNAAFNQYQTIRPLSEIAALVGFTVQTPTHIPNGCVLEGARYNPQLPHEATLIYQCNAPTTMLTLVQHTKDDHYIELMPVGASAQVQTVMIGSVQGEYVVGRWDRGRKGELVWKADPHSLLLRWQAGEVEYAITATGFQLTDLVEIAGSMK